MDVLHTTEVMAIFEIFLSILAKIWLPWQCPLDPCNQKCLIWIGRPRKPPVISNCILVISCRNAFICIYINFSPKIGCHGNAPLSLVYRSVTDEFPDGTNPISKTNSACICCIQLKLWPFCLHFGLFWPNFGCHGNVPSTLAIRNVFFGLVDHENPVISNHVPVISCRNALYAFIAILVPKLVTMVTPLCPLCTGVSQMNSQIEQTLSQNQTLHGCVAYN